MIPSNLGNFIHLRYLRIEVAYVRFIPASILNLWNLQTIDLGPSRRNAPISFPVQMWKLKHLRNLNTRRPIELRGSCAGSNEKMWNLQTIFSIVLNRQAASLITKGTFPNLKMIGLRLASGYEGELPKLLQSLQQLSHLNKIEILLPDRIDTGVENSIHESGERNSDCRQQELLQSLGQLNCLTVLNIKNALDLLTCALTFPPNLIELRLSGINCITDEGVNGLGNLAKLKILRLMGNGIWFGNSFDLNCVGVFKMKFLKLGKWKLSNGAMPRLQSLVINYYEWLEDLPNELWYLSGLRKIQITEPSEQMTRMLRNLEISNGVQLLVEGDDIGILGLPKYLGNIRNILRKNL